MYGVYGGATGPTRVNIFSVAGGVAGDRADPSGGTAGDAITSEGQRFQIIRRAAVIEQAPRVNTAGNGRRSWAAEMPASGAGRTIPFTAT